MKKNMGNLDRGLRVLAALILGVLYFMNIITGTFGIVVLVFACVMLLSSIVGSCPPYGLLGINTCKVKEQK